MIKKLPFTNDHQNVCYVFENIKNSYYDFYVEINNFANYTEKFLFNKLHDDQRSIFDSALIAFKQHYLTKNSAFWASFLGPSYGVGCSLASYEILDMNEHEEDIAEYLGLFCYFKTIEDNLDKYIVGKGCSMCKTACNLVYNNLCN